MTTQSFTPLTDRILTLLRTADRSQSELMDELGTDRQTIAPALAELKASGKVESYFDPHLMYRLRQGVAMPFPWFQSNNAQK
ncbi:winged helix-turn-helix domain-containing protein [Leptolyngbya ohadii]|uniref:winged helix-turn-helix domain-containing protein n=1 Tax=Leptolyngbya ohadii TaxID=1962290 RepID=UPI000B59C38D|nr:winged helix-turn-helix domain-containing protein [Leptolyngbya ohadii]